MIARRGTARARRLLLTRAFAVAVLITAGAAAPASCAYPAFQFGKKLPCGELASCLVGQVCCFYPSAGDEVCRAPGQCPLSHTEFSCTTADDCDQGQVCCAVDENHDGLPDAVRCQGDCTVGNVLMCATAADCPSGEPCLRLYPGFPGYRGCLPK